MDGLSGVREAGGSYKGRDPQMISTARGRLQPVEEDGRIPLCATICD